MGEAQFRMIAIDLDGTLLSPSGSVTPRTREAVHGALHAGMLVCFATGRNWTESQAVLDAVQHYATAVFVGGAMVVDTHRKATVHRTLMDGTLAGELCAFLESRHCAALALQDTEAAGVDYLCSDGIPLDPATEHWMMVTRAKLKKVRHLGTYKHEHTIRVGIVADEQKCAELMAELNQRFATRILVHSISVPSQNVNVMEIFDPAVNKWQGILHVAGAHGIEPDQIIAIGDDLNDLPMLKHAGLGVAMGNARPEVKAVAKKVIKSNKDDGLAEFLEELVREHAVKPLEE